METPQQQNLPQPKDASVNRHWFFALISLYRLRAAFVLLALGLALFMGQSLTIGITVRPDTMLAWIVVYDLAEYNTVVAGRQQQSEQAPEATTEPKPMPRTDGHYFGEPAEGFAERFAAFREKLPATQNMQIVPAQVRQVPSRRIVPAGAGESLPVSILDETSYYHLTLTAADAGRLLHHPLAGSASGEGASWIGPFPYTSAAGERELLEENGTRRSLRPLPDSASALQGMIISSAAAIAPNALFLLPMGDQSAGDFALAVNRFNTELSNAILAATGEGGRPDIVPSLGFSDLRHDLIAWLMATAGECLFLIGGFLLCFHLFMKIADREPKEGRPLGSWIIGACRLVRDHASLYGITVAIFMLFWLMGMVSAFTDPGGQARLVQVFSNQLAGTGWPLGFAGRAYASGNILEAALTTFVVNFFWGTVVILTVFSLIPIGTAFIINLFRGQMIGQALAPTKAFFGQALVPHLVTMVIELQGYLIAGFLAVLLALAVFKPERMGYNDRWQAFRSLALWQFRGLPLIAIILAVAAIYEAIEIILMRMFF